MKAAVVMALVVVALGGRFESSAAHGAAVTAAVTVGTDALRYRPGQTIVVTIRNGHAVPVVAATGHASCSIVSLDRRTTLGWVEVRNCYAGAPPVPVRIAPGATVRVRLRDRLQPGTYRARLKYQMRQRPGQALSRTLRVDR